MKSSHQLMSSSSLSIVVVGLSLTSSWGNGHATTYRSLLRGLSQRGHRVDFLEKDQLWYRENRDMPHADFANVHLYRTLNELRRYRELVRSADIVVLGSFVEDGIEIARWIQNEATGITAFYDIDTPVTLELLKSDQAPYLSRFTLPGFDLYLSFTGGPVLKLLEQEFGARRARALYCSVDPEYYAPRPDAEVLYDLGYLGTYSLDRQPKLEQLLLDVARSRRSGQFIVAGPQYPADVEWPANVERNTHVSPQSHSKFYGAQRYTLNITRRAMVNAGYSPSVRLFEAAACGVPIVTDRWPGLEQFFNPREDLFVVDSTQDVLDILSNLTDRERLSRAQTAREKVLGLHSAFHRAQEFEHYVSEIRSAETQDFSELSMESL